METVQQSAEALQSLKARSKPEGTIERLWDRSRRLARLKGTVNRAYRGDNATEI